MQLAEQNKLKTEDKLHKFIPDYPRGDEITIKNLLNHTSGIFDYTRTQKFRNMMGQRIKLNKVIELFKEKDLNQNYFLKYLSFLINLFKSLRLIALAAINNNDSILDFKLIAFINYLYMKKNLFLQINLPV